MEMGGVFLVVGLGAIALIPIVVNARVFLKFLGRPIGCVCTILGLPLLPVGFISSDNGMIAAAVVALALGVTLLLGGRTKTKQKARRNAPLYSSLSEMAAAIESGELKIDATLRAVLLDVYDTICGIADETSDDETIESLSGLLFDLEGVLYPNGMSEKQMEAANKRQQRKSLAKIKTANSQKSSR